MKKTIALPVFLVLTMGLWSAVDAQSLNLGIRNTGISFGNSENWNGLRINFRDVGVETINGINVTFLKPVEPVTGNINGLAIGLPITGGNRIQGLSLSLAGTSATESLSGLHLAGLGLGAGSDVRGISVAGLGIGSGGSVSGVTLTGLGIGSGGAVSGVSFAFLGIGAGEHITGLTVAGVGIGSGGDITGINFAGVGMGSGGNITGINFGGIALASGEDIFGLNFGGIALAAGENITGINISPGVIASGGHVRGINVGGIAVASGGRVSGATISALVVASPQVNGFTAAMGVAGEDLGGLILAPVMTQVEEGGSLYGVSVSPYNRIRGKQTGLTIGILNYTRSLHGVQLGVVNIVSGNPAWRKFLPVVNWNFM